MIVPLILVGAWSFTITFVSLNKSIEGVDLSVDSILLTIMGFVVGLSLSFRNSTAYERYAEGRKLWAQLTHNCQQLGRGYWVHTPERKEFKKQDILAKVTVLNLLVAFAVALKHKLRFEPYTHYDDLSDLIAHLDTFAKDATEGDRFQPKQAHWFKQVGSSLGLQLATSNPRKMVKKAAARAPIGNLPLEILCYLGAYTDELVAEGRLVGPALQNLVFNGLTGLNDVMVHTERVLTTPLPIAYSIAISQITIIYVFLLPFQLLAKLGWLTIPASLVAAYIILGLLFIGREIENPFGDDVNDLPLELYCAQIVADMETIAARPKAPTAAWVQSPRNKVLFPYSHSTYDIWMSRPEEAIRVALRKRPHTVFEKRQSGESDESNGVQEV